jgi:hypothetical protein
MNLDGWDVVAKNGSDHDRQVGSCVWGENSMIIRTTSILSNVIDDGLNVFGGSQVSHSRVEILNKIPKLVLPENFHFILQFDGVDRSYDVNAKVHRDMNSEIQIGSVPDHYP